MSKKVVTFLVVLFVATALLIVVIKKVQKPTATDGSQTVVEQQTSTGSGLVDDEESVTEDTASDDNASTQEETASTTGETSSDETATTDSTEEAASTDKTDKDAGEEPVVEESEDAKPIVLDSDGSLLNPSASLTIDMDNALAERTMGDPDAPVTVIEYASLTCPHCARFSNDILPKVKQQLIDTGRLRLVFRDYPLDTHALKAAMMARCTDRSKYFNLVEVIFKNQKRWVASTDPLSNLKQLGALAGMDSSYIDSCLANSQLQQFILSRMQDARRKYKVEATPTFIFNNGAETLSGDQNPEDFLRIVNKLDKKGN